MTTTSTGHPALAEDPEVRADYACLVARIALADGTFCDDEADDLRGLCEQLELDDTLTEDVLSYARAPDQARVRKALDHLKGSALRFTLVTDMVVLGLADGRYSMPERKQVRGIATAMGVTEEQVTEIERYVLDRSHKKADREADSTWSDELDDDSPLSISGEIVSRLAAVGVPAAALVAVTPLDEVGFAAVHAGLKTLGLGLGAPPGVGVLLGIGAASFVGVRYLWRHTSDGPTNDDA